MPKILLCDYKEPMNRNLEIEKQLLTSGFLPDVTVETMIYEDDNDALLAALADVDALLTAYIPMDEALLSQAKHLKFISIQATGYNYIDIKAAEKLGIGVSVIGEYCTQEVADHTMTLALSVARNIKVYTEDIETAHKFDFMAGKQMIRLEQGTFGICGLGKIGQAVARRAQGFGMKTIAFDPYCSKEAAAAVNTTLVSKEELLKHSDIISLNMLLTKETEHFLDEKDFALMEKCPIIVNVSRGAMIRESALCTALDNGTVYGAGLDVLVDESYEGTKTNPLVGRPNVIITPHAAFYSDFSMLECARIATENILYYLDGQTKKVNRMLNSCNVEQK